MIISPSHTLEYKPNDIIITSSIGYVLLHNPNIIETIRHLDYSLPGSTSKDLGGGASVIVPTGHSAFSSNIKLISDHMTLISTFSFRGEAEF